MRGRTMSLNKAPRAAVQTWNQYAIVAGKEPEGASV